MPENSLNMSKSERKPVIAVVGRPNVGKSSFVNRLVGKRESIVDDSPGVTRDRIYFDVEMFGKQFKVIDTGGIIPDSDDEILNLIYIQADIAMQEADAIVFVVDGREGLNPVDKDIANFLRKGKKPVFLAVNKIDTIEKISLASEFYALSMGEPYPVSAMHGSGGIGDIMEDILKVLPQYSGNDETAPIKIAIAGKPNVGKSQLLNAILGKERVIVSDVAGTTRDAINIDFEADGRKFVVTDTAGIRKKAKVQYGIERFSVERSIKAIKNSDVTLLLISAEEGITDQDKKIAEISNEAGRGLVILVNKWDLVEDKKSNTINEFTKKIRQETPYLDFAPMLFISALTGQRVNKIFSLVVEAYESATRRIATPLLNKVILEAFALNPPQSGKGGKKLKAFYSTQAAVQAPTFIIFVNDEKLVKPNYERYLENKLRESFGFSGSPVKILFRGKNKGD